MAVSHSAGARNLTQALCKSNRCFYLLSQLQPRKTAGSVFTAGHGALAVFRPNSLSRQLSQCGLWSCSSKDPVHCPLTSVTGLLCFLFKTARNAVPEYLVRAVSLSDPLGVCSNGSPPGNSPGSGLLPQCFTLSQRALLAHALSLCTHCVHSLCAHTVCTG